MSKISLPSPRAVLFDWDGTLVESFPAILEALRQTQCELGLNGGVTVEMAREAMAQGATKNFIAHLFPNHQEQAREIFFRVTPDLRLGQLKEVVGVLEVIQFLKDNNIPMAVVSNAREHIVQNEVVAIGWKDYFSVVVGGLEGLNSKPAPDLLYKALDRMGISQEQAHQVWFVGDMAPDHGAARAAGCPFFYYTGGIADPEEIAGLDADLKFNHFNDFRGSLFQTLGPSVVSPKV